MKITSILSAVLFCLYSLSCTKNAIDVEDLSRFHAIYIIQAGEGYDRHILDITDSIQTIALSAGLGGKSRTGADIQITVAAYPDLVDRYNEEHLTNYQVMPAGSYEIESNRVVIGKGKPYSTPLNIKFKTKDYVEPGVSYLLPVGVAEVDAAIPINEQLRVAYIRITGTYPLGEEPPTQVFELSGRGLISVMALQGALVVVESNGLFNVYEYDGLSGKFKQESAIPNGGWNIFDLVLPTADGLITRWAGTGDIWEYGLNVETRAWNADYQTKGVGFGAYDILTYSQHLRSIIARKATGELLLISKVSSQWTGVAVLGDGFDTYSMLEAYQNGLLAADNEGDLWFIELSADRTLLAPKLVGTGWNKYSKLIANNNNLLALDFSGKLWQYMFDLRGTWNVD